MGTSSQLWQSYGMARLSIGAQQKGGNNYGNKQQQKRSIYGSSAGNGSGVNMGAPLPSRFVVIERIKRNVMKSDVKRHSDWKNVNLRSIKLMSKEDSMFKRYLLEVSVEHVHNVISGEFWPEGVRVRPFRGKGTDWVDREVAEEVAEVVAEVAEEVAIESPAESENSAESNNSAVQSS